MKILLISDFGLKHNAGGAQQSNELIIREGNRRGHEVHPFHFDSSPELLQENYDAVISSNLEVFSRINPHLVQDIAAQPNHVRLEHDSNLYWNQDFRKKFWGSCRLSFFLTQFHHDFFVEMYGDIFPNVRIVPDPLNEAFQDLEYRKDGKIGYVGFFHPLKGTDNFLQYVKDNPLEKFLVAGWGDEKYVDAMKAAPNVEFVGQLTQDQMPHFYNSLTALYYNPVCKEPFCRSVGEALMCEVPIIGDSEQIGSLEMFKDDPEGFRGKCVNAATTFWEVFEREFQ